MSNAGLLCEIDRTVVVPPVTMLKSGDSGHLRQLATPCIEDRAQPGGLLTDAEVFPYRENFSGMHSQPRLVRSYQQVMTPVAAVADNGFLAQLPRHVDCPAAARACHFG